MINRYGSILLIVLFACATAGPPLLSAGDDTPVSAEGSEASTAPPTQDFQIEPSSEDRPLPSPDQGSEQAAPPDAASTAAPIEPNPSEAHYVLGLSRLNTGDLIGAVEELREALRLQPDFVQARLSLGSAFYQMGDLDDAVEAYRAALQAQPDFAPAHLHLATALMVKRDWSGARDELQHAVRLQPDLVQAHYNLGVVLYTLGDRQGALEAYRQALAFKPDYADAHFNLGLLLKMNNQEAEAAHEFYAAALAGLAKAEYFLGNAYAMGRGAERNLALAIQLWFRAADQNVLQAREALAQLRQTAVARTKQSPEESRAVLQAFADFRKELWKEFPDLAPQTDTDSLGVTLLKSARIQEAIPILIQEASALSEPAQLQLETLYEHGLDGHLPPYDGRILAYFKAAAEEGLPHSKVVMARLYTRGLGVPVDANKAKALLKGHGGDEAKALLKEIAAMQPNNHTVKRTTKSEPGKSP
jgi:tetratricopeptide (TPR) repeat protein